MTAAPAMIACPFDNAGSSRNNSCPTDSTLSRTFCWSTGLMIRKRQVVLHCDSTSAASLPGRWLISPTPRPNLRPSPNICLRIPPLTTSSPAGAK